jgi:hypothetical protein
MSNEYTTSSNCRKCLETGPDNGGALMRVDRRPWSGELNDVSFSPPGENSKETRQTGSPHA